VLTPPPDLDQDGLVRALAYWGLREARLVYLPVGFGAHHWRAEGEEGRRAFVTVDDLGAGFQRSDDLDTTFAVLECAYRTAAALRDEAGLEFVLAPLSDGEGVILRRLAERHAVSVAPFLDGTSSSYGEYESRAERRRMGDLLGRLHAAGERIAGDFPRRDDCSIPSRPVLDDALATLDEPWGTGPFADSTRALLVGHAETLEVRLRSHDALAARVVDRAGSWVITHGEPHRANVMLDVLGGLRLVDWDTTLIAPRERDLCMVFDERLTGWSEYSSVIGEHVALDREALELYRQWWDLADIAVFVGLFRRPHVEDENTVASFKVLRDNLANESR
jgi:spectinomycin phosphotransferase